MLLFVGRKLQNKIMDGPSEKSTKDRTRSKTKGTNTTAATHERFRHASGFQEDATIKNVEQDI